MTSLVDAIRDALAAGGDPERAAAQQRYMKSAMPYRGHTSPALRALLGHEDPFWPRIGVPTLAPLPPNGPRRHYLRGKLSRNDVGFLQVTPILETDSAHSSSLALADALIVLPEDHPGAPPGEIVEVIPLNWG